MSKLREYQIVAGQFTRLNTAGHAKNQAFFNNSGCGPRKDGSRIDLVKTQLGKKGSKSGQLLFKERGDRLNGNVFRAEAQVIEAGHQVCWFVHCENVRKFVVETDEKFGKLLNV